jgi:hypothetical protein
MSPTRCVVLAVVVLVLVLGAPAQAAETLTYDVTTFTFTFVPEGTPPFTEPGPSWVASTQRIEITDRGPQADSGTRWISESLGQLFVTERAEPSVPLYEGVFHGNCPTSPLEAQTTAALGFVDFAWMASASDPYAFFCLKQAYVSPHYAILTDSVSLGRRVNAPPRPPLRVFITQPRAGGTVSGTVWLVLWVEGTSGASNVFTLGVDGTQLAGSYTLTTGGPMVIPWSTLSVPNGTHTVTGTVRDATGNTGTTSLTIILKN